MAHIVETWDIEHVIEFFREIGLRKYEKDIKKNKLDGKKLVKSFPEGAAGSIKGIKSKEDTKKIQQALVGKIYMMDKDELYTYDGFTKDEFDDVEAPDEDYEEPDISPPQSRPAPVLVSSKSAKPPPPLSMEESSPPVLFPRKSNTSEPDSAPPPLVPRRGSHTPHQQDIPPPQSRPVPGFKGKPPPEVPKTLPRVNPGLFSKFNTKPKPVKVIPQQQVGPEEEYEELDNIQKPPCGNHQTVTRQTSSDEDYMEQDIPLPQPTDLYDLHDDEAIPSWVAPTPPKKQISVPNFSTSPAMHIPVRSQSDKNHKTKNFNLDTQAIRGHMSNLRKTRVQDINFNETQEQPQEPEVDPSLLSVKERRQLIVNKEGSRTLPPGIKQPTALKPKQLPDGPVQSPNDRECHSPRRPPEPLPKPKQTRDSGVSMTSNFSANSQRQQQDRGSTITHRPVSHMSTDSSFSDGSYRSRGAENSSGITVVTRPKQQTQFHQTSLESLEWFHGHIQDRRAGEAKLRNHAPGQNGVFLVRMSTKGTHQPYTLMLTFNNEIKNLPICVRPKKDNKYALGNEKPDEQLFNSVEELIGYHRHQDIIVTDQYNRTCYVTLGLTPPKLDQIIRE